MKITLYMFNFKIKCSFGEYGCCALNVFA